MPDRDGGCSEPVSRAGAYLRDAFFALYFPEQHCIFFFFGGRVGLGHSGGRRGETAWAMCVVAQDFCFPILKHCHSWRSIRISISLFSLGLPDAGWWVY